MRAAQPALNEAQRLAALRRYEILDTPPENCFDRFTRLAALLLNVPVAVISFVDADRQWFKARLGSDIQETPRDIAFCAHAILGNEPMIVEDARHDERFEDNPLVTAANGVCFYVGAPIRTRDGCNIGVLCAIDHVPRRITPEQAAGLSELSALVMDELELRIANNRLSRELDERRTIEAERSLSQQRLADFLETASDWLWETDQQHRFRYVSEGELTVLTATELLGRTRIEVAGASPDHPNWAAHLADLDARRAFRGFRYSIDLGGDRLAHVEVSGKPVFADAGHFLGYRGTGRNVTTLLEAEKSIRDMSTRLDAALTHMSDGLCMFDTDHRLSVCNEAFRLMYRLSQEACAAGVHCDAIVRQQGEEAAPVAPKQTMDAGGLPDCGIESRMLRELADGRTISVMRKPLPDGGWLETHKDVTEQRKNEKAIMFLAHNDPLTGLPNRTCFLEHLHESCRRMKAQGEPTVILMVDLDRFKDVNDSLGHAAGDALLKEAARRLSESTRETDRLARIGGDEFAIIQTPRRNGGDDLLSLAQIRENAATLADRIIDLIGRPYQIDGQGVVVGVSIGIAIGPTDGEEPSELMKKADLALYCVKEQGRNDYCFFRPEIIVKAEERDRLERELRDALAHQQFELHYQPIVDINTLAPRLFEALVRWRHPKHGLIPPDRFIPIAEQTGLIGPLGEWVLQAACLEAARWPSELRVSVNISPAQFGTSNLLNVVLCALVESGLSPDRLEIEITEGILLENEERNLSILQRVKSLGVAISLDDFGIGYSSLSYLATFPFDKIKIDRSFIRGLPARQDCAAIVRAAASLGKSLGMTILAEGVELHGQLEALRGLGVDQAQGLLFGPAVPASAVQFGQGSMADTKSEVA
jgi:diguanylate cyclase (GGDEF)-like protein/PAS domain S-box-containing protein